MAGEINGRELAEVAYVAAHSGSAMSRTALFAVFASAAEPCVCESNPQNLATLAWAFENIFSVEAAVALGFHYKQQ